MTDQRLQKSYCVTGVQPPPAYNDTMRLTATKSADVQVPSLRRVASPRRGRRRVRQAGLVVVAIIGAGGLVTACGGESTGQSATPHASVTSLDNAALRYTDCMRTHGEPNMPDPTFNGRHATLDITPSSGVNPSSPQFTAASKACQHLVSQGGASAGPAITPADQADYLRAVACMRSHGFPGFPDPVFQNNNVTFNAAGSRIDTNASQYRSALTVCQKLIPAGLPDSRPDGS
jgi:hypothetical protein